MVTKAQLYRAIHKSVETKQATAELVYTTYNSSISTNAEFSTCIPGIGQGTGSNQRIGDQIRPLRLVVRGYINYDTVTYSGANLLIARQFMFQPKNLRYAPQTTSAGVDLLTNGGNPSPFTGALLDIRTRPPS